MGALAGAHAARPGGIPSHELGGGVGAGAEAASDYFQKRDDRSRGVAQKNFENRQQVTKAADEHLRSQAEIHMNNLKAIQTAHDIDEAKQNDPLRHEQLVNATTLSSLNFDKATKDLGLLNERTYKDYASVPKSDIDKFNQHTVMVVPQPDGTVKVWDRTFDPKSTPNTSDFEVRELMGLDPKTGKPEWGSVQHVKAGAGTVAQQEAQLNKEHEQLLDAASKNATVEKDKAAAAESYGKAKEAEANANALGGDVLKTTARQLVDGNEDPTQLSKRGKTYDATLKAADDYSMATYGKHFDIAQASSDYKFATSPGTQNTLKYLNSLVGADNKSGNLATLVNLSNQVKRTEFPPLNSAEAWAKLNAGDPQMAAYNAAITEVADQVAKILQGGGTGNGTSDAKLRQAQELFSNKFTKNQVIAIAGTLRELLGNRKAEMIGDNRYLKKQYAPEQKQGPQLPQGATPVNDKSGNPIGYRLPDTPAGQMIPLGPS